MQIVQLNLSTTVTLGTEESGRYTRCEGGDSADLATERERHLTTARANQTTGLTNG